MAKKFIPRRYQKKAIKFGISRPAGAFFLAPGLGKTTIILSIFKILKKLGYVDELVVVAKRRIVYNVWPREIKKWGFKFKYVIVHGSKKEQMLRKKADIRLINYDGLEWLHRQKWWWRKKQNKKLMLAADESSKLKHASTLRYRSLKKRLRHFARRYILTGSPTPNGLLDLWSQMYVIDFGKSLGEVITAYKNRYFQPCGYMGYDFKLQKGAEKKIYRQIRDLVIRYGTDELDLPPITFLPPRYVDLPPKARKAYDEMEKEFIYEWEDGEITAANAAVASGKLRQMANGGIYHNDRANLSILKNFKTVHDEKLESLVDLLEELQGEPALVTYEFGHDVVRLKKYFKKHAPQFKDAPFVGGKMKDRDMDRLITDWDKGEVPVMFGHPDSIAHGLNLQGKGGIVVYFAMTWNLENYEQFYQRVWRQGQTRRVLVYRIVARDTVDEDMIHALRRKDHTQQSLLNAMEERVHGLRETKSRRGKGRTRLRAVHRG